MSDVKAPNPPRRRPRGSLGREVILDAAERVARSGVDRLTIRAVAGELKAAPMALYNHFASLDALVEALLDRALARVETPVPSGDWRADLHRLATAHRRFLESVPWALPAYYRNPFPGPNAARLGGCALSLLADAGLEPEAAFVAWSGIVALNYGAASFMLGRPRGGEEAARRLVDTRDLASDAPWEAPAEALSDYASDQHYSTILGWYLDGVARAPNPSPAPSES